MSATRTDLTITSINHSDATKKVTNKVNYVNPNITNQQAVTLANMLVDLTKDNYQSTTRTDTTDCDTDTRANYPITKIDYVKTVSGSQTYPQIDLNNPVINMIADNFGVSKTLILRINTSYISMPIVTCTSSNWNFAGAVYAMHSSMGAQVNAWTVRLYTDQETITPEQSTITLHFDGNNQYKPFDIDIAFNIATEE